jgi:hypothetical protein
MLFFENFVKEAQAFVDLTQVDHISPASLGMFNALYEQHLYYCLAKKARLSVECYTPAVEQAELNRTLKGIAEFRQAPERTKYIHLFGEDAKKNRDVCEELARKLKSDYPLYYKQVMHIVEKTKVKVKTRRHDMV